MTPNNFVLTLSKVKVTVVNYVKQIHLKSLELFNIEPSCFTCLLSLVIFSLLGKRSRLQKSH